MNIHFIRVHLTKITYVYLHVCMYAAFSILPVLILSSKSDGAHFEHKSNHRD